MNAITAMPEALLTTPTENTLCAGCDVTGVRYDDGVTQFAHCPRCGSTCLLDTRSPFEVLAEANRNAADGTIEPGVRMERQDVAFRVSRVAAVVPAEHLETCGDCARWARIVGVR